MPLVSSYTMLVLGLFNVVNDEKYFLFSDIGLRTMFTADHGLRTIWYTIMFTAKPGFRTV